MNNCETPPKCIKTLVVAFFSHMELPAGDAMKKILPWTLVALLLCNAAGFSCSQKEEAASEKGVVEKITDQAADEVTSRIRTPIEKARSAKKQQEDQMRSMDDQIKD